MMGYIFILSPSPQGDSAASPKAIPSSDLTVLLTAPSATDFRGSSSSSQRKILPGLKMSSHYTCCLPWCKTSFTLNENQLLLLQMTLKAISSNAAAITAVKPWALEIFKEKLPGEAPDLSSS